MENLKQLLIDGKYIEAKRIILDSKEKLEQNVDILLECVEDSRIPGLKIDSTKKKFLKGQYFEEELDPKKLDLIMYKLKFINFPCTLNKRAKIIDKPSELELAGLPKTKMLNDISMHFLPRG